MFFTFNFPEQNKTKAHKYSTFRGKHQGPGKVAKLKGINDNLIQNEEIKQIKNDSFSLSNLISNNKTVPKVEKVMLPSLIDLSTTLDFQVGLNYPQFVPFLRQ